MINTTSLLQVAAFAGAIMTIVGLGAWIKKVIDGALKPIRAMSSSLEKHNAALRAVLRNSIVRVHRDFTLRKSIGRYELQSALDMYEQYKELGGNAFVDEIIDELRELPLDVGGKGAM